MTYFYTTARFGLADQVSGNYEAVMGREPRSLREHVEDYRICWF